MVLKFREKIMIGAAILIGVVMGFDQFLTQPKKKEAQTLQKEVQELNEKLASVSISLTGFNQIKKRVEEKRKEKEAITGRIPDDRQLGIFLDQLGKESQQKKIDLIRLNVNDQTAGSTSEGKEKVELGSFKKVVLDLELNTPFGVIGPFLETMISLPIFSEIEKVEIQRKEDLFPKLQVMIQQTLYVSTSIKKDSQHEGDGQKN